MHLELGPTTCQGGLYKLGGKFVLVNSLGEFIFAEHAFLCDGVNVCGLRMSQSGCVEHNTNYFCIKQLSILAPSQHIIPRLSIRFLRLVALCGKEACTYVCGPSKPISMTF